MDSEPKPKEGWKRRRAVWALLLAGVLVMAGSFLKEMVDRYIHLAVYAKGSEGMWRLQEIHDAELDYFRKHGRFLAAGLTPTQPPGTKPRPFISEHMDAWNRLGWNPDLMVRCQYEVIVPTPITFRAVARCDPDGDGQWTVFESHQGTPPHRVSPEDPG